MSFAEVNFAFSGQISTVLYSFYFMNFYNISILFLYCFYDYSTDFRLKICQSSLPSPFFLPVIPFFKEPVLVFNDQRQILIMRDDMGTCQLFSDNSVLDFCILFWCICIIYACFCTDGFSLVFKKKEKHLKEMSILHSHNTLFCPRASGEVEQISSWRKKWRAELNNFLLSYRSANQTTTGVNA